MSFFFLSQKKLMDKANLLKSKVKPEERASIQKSLFWILFINSKFKKKINSQYKRGLVLYLNK